MKGQAERGLLGLMITVQDGGWRLSGDPAKAVSSAARPERLCLRVLRSFVSDILVGCLVPKSSPPKWKGEAA